MVENYLLNIFSHGEKKQDNFVRECSSSSEKFMQPIWKTSVSNFTNRNFGFVWKTPVSFCY